VVMIEEGAVGSLVRSFGQHQERPPAEVVVDASIAALVADALADPKGEPLWCDRDEPAVVEAVEVGAQQQAVVDAVRSASCVALNVRGCEDGTAECGATGSAGPFLAWARR